MPTLEHFLRKQALVFPCLPNLFLTGNVDMVDIICREGRRRNKDVIDTYNSS